MIKSPEEPRLAGSEEIEKSAEAKAWRHRWESGDDLMPGPKFWLTNDPFISFTVTTDVNDVFAKREF